MPDNEQPAPDKGAGQVHKQTTIHRKDKDMITDDPSKNKPDNEKSESLLLEAALAYARRGWPVFPCHTPTGNQDRRCSCNKPDCDRIGKHPRTRNGVKDATTEETTIRRWWETWPNANVAIATGRESGLTVLDIDGTAGFTAIKNAGHEIQDTLSVVTSADDKRHFYFVHPDVDMRNFAGRLEKVDLRAEGGYVVAPPSLHANGRRYKWFDEEVPLERCPQWLIELGKRECAAATEATRVASSGEPIPEGQRNETLFKIACGLRGKGLKYGQIFLLLQNENTRRCNPPLADSELEGIAARAAGYPSGAGNGETLTADTLEKLKAAGIDKRTLAKIETAITANQEAAMAANLSVLKLVRYTSGPGTGGTFDATVGYAGQSFSVRNFSGAKLVSLRHVRACGLNEGVVIPDTKAFKNWWRDLVESMIAKAPVVERLPEDDVVQSVAAFVASWLLERHRVGTVDELNDAPSTNALEIDKDSLAFSLSDLTRAVRREIPDARREDYAAAFKQLGITAYTPRADKGKSRRRLRLVSVEVLEKYA